MLLEAIGATRNRVALELMGTFGVGMSCGREASELPPGLARAIVDMWIAMQA
ncbi:MAG: hypothetical protein KatS3mg082_2497 [Nitrospiraceae bacterium]|nr:MAG: hypothetical protein KatS3mg082_2497 [Nitrospiraceae bacterium]